MKKILFLFTVGISILVLGMTAAYAQHMGPGRMGPGYGHPLQEDWNYCPYCGRYLGPGSDYDMGPGMMGRGYGMGPRMMGRGYGMGPGMMGPPYYGPGYQEPQYREPQKPMEEEEARKLLEDYLASTRNPNLQLGKIEDKGHSFEAEIQTKDGSLVDRILVDKRTGWMRSVY
jgi:hypothetical protein